MFVLATIKGPRQNEELINLDNVLRITPTGTIYFVDGSSREADYAQIKNELTRIGQLRPKT